MPRDFRVYLDDILQAAQKIDTYTAGFTFESFREDGKTVDAVIRNLEIIGEAIKKIPDEVRERQSDVPWRRIAGLRSRRPRRRDGPPGLLLPRERSKERHPGRTASSGSWATFSPGPHGGPEILVVLQKAGLVRGDQLRKENLDRPLTQPRTGGVQVAQQ